MRGGESGEVRKGGSERVRKGKWERWEREMGEVEKGNGKGGKGGWERWKRGMEEAGRVDGRGEKGWMVDGDWNNVKSLRFARNAARRSLSANMEFFGAKQNTLDISALHFWR